MFESIRFYFMFLNEVYYAHQGCIYLIKKKPSNIVKYYYKFKITLFY